MRSRTTIKMIPAPFEQVFETLAERPATTAIDERRWRITDAQGEYRLFPLEPYVTEVSFTPAAA